MTNNANTAALALSISECVAMVKAIGPTRTILIEGDMGIGKSTLLKLLAAEPELHGHTPVYFDCTTRQPEDISVPHFGEANAYVRSVPHEDFGLHLSKPVLLMFDELGKAPNGMLRAVRRVLLERTLGSQRLPEGSIVFATTNLGGEGMGDRLEPHQENAIITVRLAKPTPEEFISWGIGAGLDPMLLGFVREYPATLASFTDYDMSDPQRAYAENPYIYFPRGLQRKFCTPRSLHAASDVLKTRPYISDAALRAALVGTLGPAGGGDLMAFVKMASDMPKRADIIADPHGCRVPQQPGAVCLIVSGALQAMSADWAGAWVTYMQRLPMEAQAMFANAVSAKTYDPERRAALMRCREYTDWVRTNTHLFSHTS